MEIKDCLPYLLHQFKSEQDVFDAIAEISAKFTTNRENISDYLHDERLVSAYTLYYLLTNIPKFEGVLKWLPAEFVNELKKSTFIDMGAGPGTFSFAFKNWSHSSKAIYQVELSEAMKKQARLLWNGFFTDSELIQNIPSQVDGPTVMFFGHSANEMGVETTLRYIERINPTHIVFLEPGTKDFFKKMLLIRDRLLLSTWNQVYPCSSNAQCPIKDKDDWCHQYIHHVHTDELERVGQKVGINRRFMSMTFQVFSNQNVFQTAKAKLMRVKDETKFSFEWVLCHNEQIYEVQVMKRGLNKAQIKELSQALAGRLIDYQIEKVLEQGKLRIKLLP